MNDFAKELEQKWAGKRWEGIERPYSAMDVYRLRGTADIKHTLAESGAKKLWNLINRGKHVHALSAITGNQAVQEVQAGLEAVYVSGWQVAADGNTYGSMFPDQSIYPVDSVPVLLERINNALLRADQIQHQETKGFIDYLVPLVADAEAGFGGVLNAFQLMHEMIKSGAAGVHFEDQLSSEKKCGHLGGKVLVPTREFIDKLVAARLAADCCGVDTILIARTDSHAAKLITNDTDPCDAPFITGDRTSDGFYKVKNGVEAAIARGLAYAPYADLLWWETSTPDLHEAQEFADAIHEKFPGKLLAYNCSPSFNWKKNLSDADIATFQDRIGEMGYKFQFVTLSGFHSLNHSIFELACGYRDRGMAAYSALQQREFASQDVGYSATEHQGFVGTYYFDAVRKAVSRGESSTLAMEGSTADQFKE